MVQDKAGEIQPVVLKHKANKQQQQKRYSMPGVPAPDPGIKCLGFSFPGGVSIKGGENAAPDIPG